MFPSSIQKIVYLNSEGKEIYIYRKKAAHSLILLLNNNLHKYLFIEIEDVFLFAAASLFRNDVDFSLFCFVGFNESIYHCICISIDSNRTPKYKVQIKWIY